MSLLELSGKPSRPDSAALPETAERTLRVLEEAFAAGRLAHALLFYGDSLPDLESVAYALAARFLNSTLQKVVRHTDLLTLRPANKMRQIHVDATRKLIRSIHHSPQQGLRKVALIHEVDRMNIAAANAFLKTLEEPPSDTILLLLTTRPHSVLDTLRSRCLHFSIPCEYPCIEDAAWREWQQRYVAWLGRLCARPSNANERLDALLGLYGLIAQFENCLKRLSKESWQTRSETLPSGIDPAQRDALEAGAYKGLRRQLFLEVEQCTYAFARQKLDQSDRSVAAALIQSVNDLEHCAGLLEVNLTEVAAIEYFLLRSLRNWAR